MGVTSVHPGGIRTRTAGTARVAAAVPAEEAEQGRRDFARLLGHPPGRADERIVRAVEQRQPGLLIGEGAVVPDVLVRVLPGSGGRLLAGATRLGSSLAPRRSR